MLCVVGGRALRRLVASGALRIEPFVEGAVGSLGYDLAVSGRYLEILISGLTAMECPRGVSSCYLPLTADSYLEFLPGHRYLLSTVERVEMPVDYAGLVVMRSTYARLGFLAPPTIVDPGFRGTITLEVSAPPYRVRVRRGARMFTLVLLRAEDAEPYTGRYQGQSGPTPPKPEPGEVEVW